MEKESSLFCYKNLKTMNYDITELLDHAEEGYQIPCYKDDGSVDLFAKSHCGDTLLHVAVGRQEPEAVRYLVNQGLDINAQGDFFETPLYLASSFAHTAIVDLLFQLGADPDIPDHLGELPADAAIREINKKTNN
jgi:ankyrin repeat protein